MNILVCGTPGTGKTTLCAELATRTGMQHINLSELVKERQLYTEFDATFQSYVIDEDKVPLFGLPLTHRFLMNWKISPTLT